MGDNAGNLHRTGNAGMTVEGNTFLAFRINVTARRNKFRAKPETVDGIRFDSGKEAKRYGALRLLELAGFIEDLQCHPKFELCVDGRPILIRSEGYPNGRRATFKPDFTYFDCKTKQKVIEDVKSRATITEGYRLRRAVFEALYFPARVEEIL